jgi:pimeloyl-ACP methyl ester carboxylesterase
MPYVDVNGARLFYTDEGSGDVTLLLIHALGADSHDWNWVIPILRSQCRVVACDLRGHGHSSVPGRYELMDFVDDLEALIAALGCAPVVPVGHSLGGAIGAAMAVERPSLVSAVVEVDPAYALPDFIVQIWEQGRRRWRDGNNVGGPGLQGPDPGPAGTSPTPEFLTTWNARRVQAMPDDVFWQCYEGLADGPQAMFTMTPASSAYLRRRACPILSFHSLPGRAAWETPLFAHPASHAVEWEGSGHTLQVERPRELALLLLNWLNRIKSDEFAREEAPA